jgi:integrase
MASLLYGAGLRLMEAVRLRVKDVDFGYRQVVVRNAKGGKDRVVPLPDTLVDPLGEHLSRVREIFDEDLRNGLGEVYLPDALAKKYPGAAREWIWQYVFPSGRVSFDPRTGTARRHHLHENGLQKAVKAAARRARIVKKVNCHSLRHSFCHPSARGRLRYPHRAGAPGTRRCLDDDDLHSRAEPGRPRGAQPARYVIPPRVTAAGRAPGSMIRRWRSFPVLSTRMRMNDEFRSQRGAAAA